MTTFKVGDRVMYIGGDKRYERHGKVGTIKGLDRSDDLWAVEFDEPFLGAHSCDGKTKIDRGWRCCGDNLKLLNHEEKTKSFNCTFYVKQDIGNFKKGTKYQIRNGVADGFVQRFNNENELRSTFGHYLVMGNPDTAKVKIEDDKLNCTIRILKGDRDGYLKTGSTVDIVDGKFKAKRYDINSSRPMFAAYPLDKPLRDIADLDSYLRVKNVDRLNHHFHSDTIEYEVI